MSKVKKRNMPEALLPRMPLRTFYINAAVILAVILITYLNSLFGQFVWDDTILIRDNTQIKDPANFCRLFTQDFGAGGGKIYHFYRPLQNAMHMLSFQLSGLNPVGYHLISVLFHALAAAAVFWLIYLLFANRIIALAASLIFALHPIQTEAVDYISGLSDPMAAAFMLSGLIAYIYFINEKENRTRNYLLVIAAYLLAVFTKESNVVFGPLLLLYHIAFKKKVRATALIPVFAITAIYVLSRLAAVSAELPSRIPASIILQRIPGFFAAQINYLKALLFPFGLHADYGKRIFSPLNLQAWAGLAVMAGAAALAWRKRKTSPLIFFGIGWYFICLIPTSNIFSAAFDITFYMAEHWIYLGAIGLFLIAAQALSRIFAHPKSKDIGLGLMLAVGAFLSARTIDQNLYWNNPIQFYQRTIALNPQAPRMMYNLGNEYRAIGRLEDAVIWYKKALELNPQDTDIMNNLAGVYGDMGKFPEAIEVLTGVIGLRPDSIAAHYNLGNIYRNSEDTQKALEEYAKVTALNPAYADAYNDMAIIYLDSHKSELAIAYFKKAVSANPYYAPAYLNLALHYAQNGNIVEARTYYSTARKLGMSNPYLEQILK